MTTPGASLFLSPRPVPGADGGSSVGAQTALLPPAPCGAGFFPRAGAGRRVSSSFRSPFRLLGSIPGRGAFATINSVRWAPGARKTLRGAWMVGTVLPGRGVPASRPPFQRRETE